MVMCQSQGRAPPRAGFANISIQQRTHASVASVRRHESRLTAKIEETIHRAGCGGGVCPRAHDGLRGPRLEQEPAALPRKRRGNLAQPGHFTGKLPALAFPGGRPDGAPRRHRIPRPAPAGRLQRRRVQRLPARAQGARAAGAIDPRLGPRRPGHLRRGHRPGQAVQAGHPRILPTRKKGAHADFRPAGEVAHQRRLGAAAGLPDDLARRRLRRHRLRQHGHRAHDRTVFLAQHRRARRHHPDRRPAAHAASLSRGDHHGRRQRRQTVRRRRGGVRLGQASLDVRGDQRRRRTGAHLQH